MYFRFLNRFHAALVLLLAVNYFAFRVELFDEEYEANHPACPTQLAFSSLSINWETFDKDNAPKAFVFDAQVVIESLGFLSVNEEFNHVAFPPYQPVRDKSPPSNLPRSYFF